MAKDKQQDDNRPKVVQRLENRLDVARQVHELETNSPVLEIVDIERLRKSVTRGLWFFLCLGLAFTSAGVQKFMAGDATPDDPIWWACWLVEPAFAGILITVLRWEAEMLARGIEHKSGWVNTLKWLLLGSTLLMNVLSVGSDTSAGMIAAHIIVPLLVFLLAEVMPVIQRRCTQARRAVKLPIEEPEPAKPTPVPTSEPTPVKIEHAPTPTPTPVDPEPVVVESSIDEDAIRKAGVPASMVSKVVERLHSVTAEGRRPDSTDLTPMLPEAFAARVIAVGVS